MLNRANHLSSAWLYFWEESDRLKTVNSQKKYAMATHSTDSTKNCNLVRFFKRATYESKENHCFMTVDTKLPKN